MQRLEVSGAVRSIYGSLGVKHVAYVTTLCNKTVVLTYTIQHYITFLSTL